MAKMFQIVGDVVTYDCSVKGGDLPKDYEVIIRVVMDCTGVTRDQLLKVATTTSARVSLANRNLRRLSTEILDKYDRTNNDQAPMYEVKMNDVITGASSINPVDVILAMPREDFVKMMVLEYGMNEPAAEKLYDKKHASK